MTMKLIFKTFVNAIPIGTVGEINMQTGHHKTYVKWAFKPNISYKKL